MSAVSARRGRAQPGPLVAARHAAGLTQEELARRAGLSVRAIRDIERGIVARPRRHSLEAIVTALDLTGENRARLIEHYLPGGVPRQLPPDVSIFTGRADAVRDLDRFLARSDNRSMVITGTPGVGKTALAIHWAHRVRSRFPDGQLYVNLRGYDPEQPASPAEVLTRFLTALGVAGRDIPADAESRACLFRTLVADRRILLLLDNASSVEQLRLLLPGTSSCAVLVTSRDSLSGLVALHGARRLDLDLLERDDALRLLRTLIGERVTAEPSAAADLVEHCARLPLALRIAAELAIRRDGTALSELVFELENRNRRLQLLQTGKDARAAVRTVFCWSYRQLPADAARLFRRLGWYPGPDIDLHAAAALGQVDCAVAADLLDILCQAHLVHAVAGGRFGMHDLLRAYAAELAGSHDKAADRKRALTTLLDYHAVTAARAMELYAPYEPQGPLQVRTRSRSGEPLFLDRVSAQAWLDTERANLISAALYAADHGQSQHTARLSRILYRYLDLGVHYDDEKLLHTAAWRTADETTAPGNYGVVLWRSGRYREALIYYEHTLIRSRYIREHRTEARMLGNMGLVHLRIGNYEFALTQFEQALEALQGVNEPHLVAVILKNTGIVHRSLGSHLDALDHLWPALDIFRRIHARFEEANTLSEIGLACAELGDFRAALDHQHEAVAIIRELGNPLFEARMFNDLGITLRLAGSPAVAAEHHRRAIALTRELDDYEHARAHQQLAHAYHDLGDPAAARTHWQRALALHSVLGTPEAHDIVVRLHSLAEEYPTE